MAQSNSETLPDPMPPDIPQAERKTIPPEERERRLAKRAQRRATVARGARIAMGIVSQLSDRAFSRAWEVVEECLDATTVVKTKEGVVEHPDHRIRLDAARLAIAYREGLPVQRQVSIQGQLGGEQWDQLEDRVFGLSPLIADREPAIRQASARLLADKAPGG